MRHYGLFGKFVVTEADRQKLVDILLQAAEALEENNDCLQYLVGTSDKDDEVWVSEIWTSKQAHDQALEPESIRSLIMQARPLIKDMPAGVEYKVEGGKSSGRGGLNS